MFSASTLPETATFLIYLVVSVCVLPIAAQFARADSRGRPAGAGAVVAVAAVATAVAVLRLQGLWAAGGAPTSRARATRSGAGRVLVAVYGIFALSATARAAVQIAEKFAQAPLAYLLSALAGVVYIVATVGLAGTGLRPPLAWAAVGFELTGVLVVGTLTVLDGARLPRRHRLVGLRPRLRLRPAGAAARRPLVVAPHARRVSVLACA